MKEYGLFDFLVELLGEYQQLPLWMEVLLIIAFFLWVAALIYAIKEASEILKLK